MVHRTAETQLCRFGLAFAGYVTTQAVGFCCNLLVYAAALTWLPAPFGDPLPALVLASAAALAVNFAGAKHVAFRRPRRRSPPA